MKASQKELKALRAVQRRLLALVNPADRQCGVDPQHKRAVRVYVTTWILPLVNELLRSPAEGPRWAIDAASREQPLPSAPPLEL